eukprot:188874_1
MMKLMKITRASFNTIPGTRSLSIPTIDISEFNTSPKKVSSEMYNHFAQFGACYVTGHGIDNALYSNLLKQSKLFFDLPLDEKLNIHVDKGGIAWRGYMPMGGEHTKGTMDRKEGLYLGMDHDINEARVVSNTPLFGTNQYPPTNMLPHFSTIINDYIHQTTQLGNTLTNIISCSLGLQPDYIQKHCIMNEPLSIFRLWKYPENDGKIQAAQGIGTHTDYGLLTLINASDDNIHGLQFQVPTNDNPDGVWIDVVPQKDAFIVSVGDLLDRMSYGIFKSRKHKVITQNQDRFTAVLFYDPSWDCEMKYLPIDDGLDSMSVSDVLERETRWDQTAYKELSGRYSDFLAQKVKRVFPDLLKDYQFEHARAESTRFKIPIQH